MNYKIEGAIRRNRKNFILYIILWSIAAIVLIPPFAYSSFIANAKGSFDLQIFIENFPQALSNPIGAIGNLITLGAFGNYFSVLFYFTIIYTIFFFIGFVRSAPKNEYTDIEHGSSDWSQRGEQYRILSNKKGIILAEDNYLPLDKRGNTNVLVVGRIRFW